MVIMMHTLFGKDTWQGGRSLPGVSYQEAIRNWIYCCNLRFGRETVPHQTQCMRIPPKLRQQDCL